VPASARILLTTSHVACLRWRPIVLTAVGWLLLVNAAASQTTAPALRSAVPILCTENRLAAHTRVRGTGLIADASGLLLTAAHVIAQARDGCTLSVLVPDQEWSHVRELHTFLLRDCAINQALDIASCHLNPEESSRDWALIRPARIRLRSPIPGEAISVTAFTGWGLLPLTSVGHIKGRQTYQRQDGCYCNFAIDIAASEGMSGSPVISAQGEVLGILTLAGSHNFRGISFGVSFEDAAAFLKKQSVGSLVDAPHSSTPFTPKAH
jgi:Trypsin-like peptidase domain